MVTWVIFLRGINVGGHNKLPMVDLRASLTTDGFENVKTYIQSGNIILNAKKTLNSRDIQDRIVTLLRDNHDLDIRVMVLAPEDLIGAMNGNPLGQTFDSPNWMFLYFLATAPKSPDLDLLKDLQKDNEPFELIDTVFYVYAGNGAGRSKLMAKIEKALGVPTTARNWRTLENMQNFLKADYGYA